MVRSKNNPSHWVCFKYERLLTFCYSCGCYGYSMKDCEKSSDDDEDADHGLQYSDWLHTSPLRRTPRDIQRDNQRKHKET